AGVVAGPDNGIGGGTAALQLPAQAPLALSVRVLLRRYPGDLLEQTVKMISAEPRALRQRSEGRRIVRGFNKTAGIGNDAGVALAARRLIRPAAQARTKAGALGRIAGFMKADVFGPRQPRIAGGTAIDAGDSDRVKKTVIDRKSDV